MLKLFQLSYVEGKELDFGLYQGKVIQNNFIFMWENNNYLSKLIKEYLTWKIRTANNYCNEEHRFLVAEQMKNIELNQKPSF